MTSASSPPTGSPLPLHLVAVDGDSGRLLRVVRRSPGRPRRVERAPDADGRAYDANVRRALADHVAADALVSAAAATADPVVVLREALVGVAVEQASIAFILERRPLGQPAERARSRRIDALITLARLQALVAVAEQGEPAPQVVQRVTEALLREVQTIAREVLPQDSVERLMAGVGARIDERERALRDAGR